MSKEKKPYYIGFYGCTGQLIKLASNKEDESVGYGYRRPFKVQTIECPSCGNQHQVQIMWRKPIRPNEQKEARLTL